MKTLPILIFSSLLCLAACAAQAQSADDFFNGGAQLYISNNIPDALNKVETGLKSYPDDVKLQKLEQLLKQQQQQQQQQNQQNQQNQQQQNKQNQSQQNKNSQNQQSQSQQQQQNQQQQDQQKQNQQNSQQQQQNQQQQQAQQQNNQNNQNAAQQGAQAQAMTPEEAKRLLDAQKGNEQVLRYQPKGQPENANPAIKDW
jgi:outer membrane biosynthesis protein TonB